MTKMLVLTTEEIEFLLECAKFGSDPLEPAEYEVETILKLTNALAANE